MELAILEYCCSQRFGAVRSWSGMNVWLPKSIVRVLESINSIRLHEAS